MYEVIRLMHRAMSFWNVAVLAPVSLFYAFSPALVHVTYIAVVFAIIYSTDALRQKFINEARFERKRYIYTCVSYILFPEIMLFFLLLEKENG